jgi:uncharacterized protein YbaP (TraB family)
MIGLFRRFREKRLKTVWSAERKGRKSFLVGTAHFFPYSFRTSIHRLLRDARVVMLEGPLDEGNMNKVVEAGFQDDGTDHIFNYLDDKTVAGIRKALSPSGPERRVLDQLGIFGSLSDDRVYDMIKGMKPWMAFFSLWSTFLKSRGWNHSVDMEAYRAACELGKTVVFLETIEEQIEVLEGMSRDMIVDFLSRFHLWSYYAKKHEKWYLGGDSESLWSNPFRFPTRDPWVIDRRDKILFERMLPELEKGDGAIFVGIPHVKGIVAMLSAEGFAVEKCSGAYP